MKRWAFFELLYAIDDVADHAAAYTEARIAFEIREAFLKIIRLKG